MSVNYKVLQERLFKRVHRTGEEIKNDFPNILRTCIEYKAWEHFKKADGESFKNLGEWLVYAFPNGISMGGSDKAISYEDALQLCKEDRELHGLLVKHRPSKGQGHRTDKENIVANRHEVVRPTNSLSSSGRTRIEQRLQAEFPSIWTQYIRGEFKSARSAGIAAGFIKDTHDPVMRLKSNWRKASRKQKNEFLRWLESEGGVEPKAKKARAK